MKFVMDNNKFIVFLNKKVDLDNKLKLEKYLKNLFKEIQIKYNIKFDGYYDIDIYCDKNYGMIIEIEKEDLGYYNYLNQIEMEISICKTDFLYEVDYSYLSKELLNKSICYKYNNELYLKIDDDIDEIYLSKLLEVSKILYNNNQIIKYGKKVKI